MAGRDAVGRGKEKVLWFQEAIGRHPVHQAHPAQHLQPGGGNTVAAWLVAGENSLVNQENVHASLGQEKGGGRASRPGSDDNDLGSEL